jgi:hypothetical protein
MNDAEKDRHNLDKRQSNCGSHFEGTEASKAIVWQSNDHEENGDTGWTKTSIQDNLQMTSFAY